MASILQQARDNQQTVDILNAKYGNTASMAQWAEAVPQGAGMALGATAIGSNIISGGIKQKKSGSVSQNIGLMNPVIEPYLIIKKKKSYNPPDENIGNNSGLPSNVCVTLNQVKGFAKVSAIHLEIEGALDEELSEIESLLKGGVILNYEQTE